ncbi:MAG: anthranilate phosphoribosyltransferase [Bacteroidota bacterium]|nr:anthranilate phosphoribosyltransferase [Bacteroidota bacterium]
MKTILNHLFEHKTLTKEEAKEVLINISTAKYNISQVAAFMSVYLMRSITVDELDGFREAMRELCLRIDMNGYETIDLCGTGGDAKNTFNISTLASFIVAGAGIKVTKHGNYGVSSACGSSNVLEFLGVKFSNDEGFLKKCIENTGFCFLHAPLFNPAMKFVAPIRKELGVKTFFNMLGPLANPVNLKFQFVGVYNLELVRLFSYLMQKHDKRYVIIHSLDGYDEISLTDKFKVFTTDYEDIVSPEAIGFKRNKPEDIYGGLSVESAAKIFVDIISGNGTQAQNNTVIVNAAFAIMCAKPELALSDAIEVARESLISGKARNVLEKVVKM